MNKKFISLLLALFAVFGFQFSVALSHSAHAQELVAETTPEPTTVIEPTPEIKPTEIVTPTPEPTVTVEPTVLPTPTEEIVEIRSIAAPMAVTAIIPTPILSVQTNTWVSNAVGFEVSVDASEFTPFTYSYEYRVGGTISGTQNMGEYRLAITGPVDISTLPDGPVLIEVRLTDGVDFSNWVSVSVTKDTVAPVITVLSVDNITNPGQTIVKLGDQIKVSFNIGGNWSNAIGAFIDSNNIMRTVSIVSGNPNVFIYTVPANIPDGLLNYRIIVSDLSLNSTTVNGTNNFVVDNSAPTGTVVVNSGAAYTTSVNVNVDVTATDTGSGVASIALSNDNITFTNAIVGTNAWVLDSAIGLKTVYLRITDTAGQSTVITDTIDLRAGLPTIPTITTTPINSTNASAYTLTGTADPLTTLSYSFNAGAVFGTGSTDVNGQFSITGLDLSALADGSVQVSVIAEDASNIQSNAGTASIVKDTIAPNDPTLTIPTLSATNPFIINGENGTTYEYILSAASGSGPMSSSSQSVLVSPIPADGTYSLQVRLIDAAGNASNWVFAQATVDATAPVASNITVTNQTVSGSNYIKVGETAQIAFTTSESLSSSTITLAGHIVTNTWTLTSTDIEGYLPYTITLTDMFGNTSVTSGISNLYFDKTNPTVNFSINAGQPFTTSPNVTLNISASDTSGVLGTWVSNDGLSFVPVISNPVSWILNTGNGSRTVYVLVYDLAGNSTLVTQNIILDTVVPAGIWISPIMGSNLTGTNVTLEFAPTDINGSGIQKVDFYVNDTLLSTNNWDITNLPMGTYVLKAVVTDNVGFVSTSQITVNVMAVVTSRRGNTIDTSRIEVFWTTDRPASGFVRYGTQSGNYPNTSGFDSNMSTSHRIELSGLSSETTYYWQIVTANNTNSVQNADIVEGSNRTFRQAQACDGGCSAPSAPSAQANNPSPTKAIVCQPVYWDYSEPVVQGESTESAEVVTPTPTVTPAILGTEVATPSGKTNRVINWWFLLFLFLILLILLAWYLASKIEDKDSKNGTIQ